MFALLSKSPTTAPDRRAEIDAILTQWNELKSAKQRAVEVVADQARHIAKLDDPTAPLAVDEEEYSYQQSALRGVRRLRDAAVGALERFEMEHSIDGLIGERAAIDAAATLAAQMVHRKEIAGEFIELLDQLEAAAATYARIVALFDQAAATWPKDLALVLKDWSILSPGLLSSNGQRSVVSYVAQMIALADPELLESSHPARIVAESARAKGETVRVWCPGVVWS